MREEPREKMTRFYGVKMTPDEARELERLAEERRCSAAAIMRLGLALLLAGDAGKNTKRKSAAFSA